MGSGTAIYTVEQSAVGVGAAPDLAGETLEMFSDLTGGRWYSSNNTARALADAIRDGRGNYTIAYYSPAQTKEKYHKIRITSTRKGVRFQTRDGFFDDAVQPQPEDIKDAAFRAARRSPLEATQIGLRVAVSPNPSAKTVRLRIYVDPADVLLEPRDTGYQGHLSFTVASYSNGFLKQARDPEDVDLNLTQEQLEKATKNGITISKDVPMGDNIQKLRVIVFDRALDAVGSVTISDVK